MFSVKMICAIQILVELGSNNSQIEGVKTTDLKERCTVASYLVIPVLKTLLKEGYVCRNNKGVLFISKNIETVSFYSILSILHRDINIGDCSASELKGPYKLMPSYGKLVEIEKQMDEHLKASLKKIKVLDILNNK